MKNQYRQNVLAVIFNQTGDILLGRYSTGNQTRTFPKGGINNGESDLDALYRELDEELGLKKDSFELIYQNPQPFIQKYSPKQLKWKIANKGEYYIGKSETIFYLKFNGGTIDISKQNEFCEYIRIKTNELTKYIQSPKLLDLIDMKFLERIIKKDL